MPRRAEVPELENRMKYGGKKFVRYEEGAKLYSMGLHTFQDLASHIFKEHSDRKKWLKRVAARRVRSAPPDCLYNYGDYKRLYDLWWTLW